MIDSENENRSSLSLNSDGDMQVGGDVVGRDKVTINTNLNINDSTIQAQRYALALKMGQLAQEFEKEVGNIRYGNQNEVEVKIFKAESTLNSLKILVPTARMILRHGDLIANLIERIEGLLLEHELDLSIYFNRIDSKSELLSTGETISPNLDKRISDAGDKIFNKKGNLMRISESITNLLEFLQEYTRGS